MNYNLDTTEGMANAIAWTDQMLSTLKDDGVWVVPRSGSLVHFNKIQKTANIVSLFPDPSLARVLTAMGYQVKERDV